MTNAVTPQATAIPVQELIKDVNTRSARLAKHLPHFWKSGSAVWSGVDMRKLSLIERVSLSTAPSNASSIPSYPSPLGQDKML